MRLLGSELPNTRYFSEIGMWLETGRFDVSCLGIVGLHMGGHELFIVRSFEKLMTW